MAHSNEHKKNFCVGVIVDYLGTLDTYDKFIAFVDGITPEKIRAKLKKAWQDEQAKSDVIISSAQEKKINDSEMELEF